MDLALNNLQRLICHKTQTNKQTNQKAVSSPDFLYFSIFPINMRLMVPTVAQDHYYIKIGIIIIMTRIVEKAILVNYSKSLKD